MNNQFKVLSINDQNTQNTSSPNLSSRTRNNNSQFNRCSKSQTNFSNGCLKILANELSLEKNNEKFNTYINIENCEYTVLEDISRKKEQSKSRKESKRPCSSNENIVNDRCKKISEGKLYIIENEIQLDQENEVSNSNCKKDAKDINFEVIELSNVKTRIEKGRVDLFPFSKLRSYYKNIYFEYPKNNQNNKKDQSLDTKLLNTNNNSKNENHVFRSSFKNKNQSISFENNIVYKEESLYLPLNKIFKDDPSQKWIDMCPEYQEKFTFGNSEESNRSNRKNKRSRISEDNYENNVFYIQDNWENIEIIEKKNDSLVKNNFQEQKILSANNNEESYKIPVIKSNTDESLNEKKNIIYKKISNCRKFNNNSVMNTENAQIDIDNIPLMNLNNSSYNQINPGLKICKKRIVSHIPNIEEVVSVDICINEFPLERSIQDEISVNSKRLTSDFSETNDNEPKENLKTNDSVIERHEICLNQKKSFKGKFNHVSNIIKTDNTKVQEVTIENEDKSTLPNNSATKILRTEVTNNNYYYRNTIPSEETYFATDQRSYPIDSLSNIPTDRKSNNHILKKNIYLEDNRVYKCDTRTRTVSESNFIYTRFSNAKFCCTKQPNNISNYDNIDFLSKIRENREALEKQYSKRTNNIQNYNFLNLERSNDSRTSLIYKLSRVVLDYQIGAFKHIEVRSPKLERYHPQIMNKKRPTKRNNNILSYSSNVKFMENTKTKFSNYNKGNIEYSFKKTKESIKTLGSE